MATIGELLEEPVQALVELAEKIKNEVSGSADLETLGELADQLGARSDAFAATLTNAREALAGGGGGSESGGGEEGSDGGQAEGDGSGDDEESSGQ